ncbi:MAG: AgmX/PglI C-terminal domain-containing protein [Candidatus Alcyoniella australis]|nr:AgmX/PglI C-terminal domain-containing protein [Candidatus Alcyoniella australis]
MAAKGKTSPSSGSVKHPGGKGVGSNTDTMVSGLKVGLVQDGKIIEERLLKPGRKLTVGTDPSNTFVLLEQGLPKKHTLFHGVEGQWSASFLGAMRGKYSVSQGMVDLADLAKEGSKGDAVATRLDERSKGKISVGESVILFQVVRVKNEPPIMELPKELRKGFLKSFDVHFVVILVVSALLHWLVLNYVEKIEIQEYAKARRPEIQYERYTGPIEPIPDMTPEEEEEEETETKPGGPGSGSGGDRGGTNDKQTDVRNVGVLAIITRDGPASGAIGEIMSSDGLGNLQDAVGQIGGVEAYRGGTVRRGKEGEGGGPGGTVDAGNLGSLGSGGAENVGSGDEKVERQVKGSVGGNVGAVSGKLDRGVISSYVRSKMGGIRSCYERELKKNPALSGKITVTFTVGGDGKVSSASVAGATLNDPSVQSCVVRMVRRWRFTPPEDGGAVTVTYPFVFTAVGN